MRRAKIGIRQAVKIGSQLEIEIQGLGSFGEGLGRVEIEGESLEIFVPKAAPRDLLKVELIEKKKGRYRAEIKEILTPSPLRRSPECKHFNYCGGCDFQHLAYSEQLAWKERITKHWLRRSPLAPFIKDIEWDPIAAPSEYGYRRRVRLQVKDHKLHYFLPHSQKIFEIEECPILKPGFLDALKAKAKTSPSDIRDWNQSFEKGELVGDLPASYSLAGCTIHYDRQCFTQGNDEVNELMWSRLESNLFEMPKKDLALDLFCGIGNFSLPLKTHFEKVIGVEIEPNSMRMARKNSREIEWMEATAEEGLKTLLQKRSAFDLVVLDPPRAGAFECMPLLKTLAPPRITYISCSLESLVRDLIPLVARGPYRIARWSIVDLFPQTHHIESIVSLRHK